ncbi:NAD(P)-binding protein [Coniochaeta ligniaria NRRL 30616]|uniref:NAD(P)-binding protein n=1 Tax=Coniochaeta ligniaria NRRL 30616 TaxID=1408157 RepID=A0A1J7JHE5_9PEZI|nr:NAD(P)-binding protein [Coniochaeta ligniaria NRRL 30616]
MSAQLEKQSSSQASFLHNVRRVFRTVPPIPSDLDLTGKTALVTGSNVGLGLECSRHFLKLRASRLILAVRSLKKGETAAQGLRAEFPDSQIDVWELDMLSFRSVQAFAARCNKELDRLHVAVLNAGFGTAKFERAEEGRRREVTLQVNYLATALLAVLLIPKMKPTVASPDPARLTIVASDAGLGAKIKDPGEGGILDSLDKPDGYFGFAQYAYSKLLIVMFIAKLAESIDPTDVIINCTNPAATKGTAFLSNVDGGLMKSLLSFWLNTMGRSAVDAARIYVHSSLVLGKESHGSFTEWDIRPWPVMMYGEDGRRFVDKLWKETLEELSFAGIAGVLETVKH